MATTTDLGNVNIFSSLASFNSNKANLKSNDLNFIKQTAAEMATVGGGIVDELLEENGYVKFANGLILQWGKTDSISSFHYTNVTLPIAFSRVCYGCVASVQTGDVNSARQSGNCVEYTTTLVRVGNVYCDANSNGKVSWFAYGI